jgi:hypothetical protein
VLEFHSLDKKEKKWSYLITMKKTDLISHASNLCSLEVEGVYEEKSIPYAPGLESYSVKSTDCLKLKRNPIKKSVFDNYDNNKTNPSGYFSSTLKMLDDVLVNSKSFIKLGADESAWDIVRNLNVDALVKKDNVYKFTFEVYKSSLNKYSLCNAIAKENQKNYNGFSIESSNCFN